MSQGQDLRRYIEIESPEATDLVLELAGPGSRFVAFAVDFLIQGAIGLALLVVMALAMWVGAGAAGLEGWIESVLEQAGALVAALALLAVLLVHLGYFIVLEMLWNGQTPGKRLVGLRVVMRDGRGVTLVGSALRNFVRIADAQPITLYLVGLTSIIASKTHQRLGDWAGGTVVIRQRARLQPHERRAGSGEEAGVGVEALDYKDLEVARRFLDRAGDMEALERGRLAMHIARGVATKCGAEMPATPAEAERFLDEVVGAGSRLQRRAEGAPTVEEGERTEGA